MKTRKIISAAADLFAVMLFVYLLIFPGYASESTARALSFCGKTLVPALFIFTVLSKIIITHPLVGRLMNIFGCEAVSLACGLLCGSPIGAKNALELYEAGRIEKKHAEYLLSFTGNASLSFVLGYVGSELLGSLYAGAKLFVFQLAGSVTAAVIMKLLIFGKAKLPKCARGTGARISLGISLTDAAQTMLTLCSTAVFFIIASGAVSRLFALPPFADAVLGSALEFSSGCAKAARCKGLGLPLCAFAIGFGGLSVAMQVKAVIKNKLAFKPYLAGKAISGATTVLLAAFFG